MSFTNPSIWVMARQREKRNFVFLHMEMMKKTGCFGGQEAIHPRVDNDFFPHVVLLFQASKWAARKKAVHYQ
ncbi:hypothetical protein [Chromobacterium amazonense]|uniref:hypothetical protein n=1 Tax=Chromobacterium amazonense TaxID=1382803 RepID=UPI0031F64FFB